MSITFLIACAVSRPAWILSRVLLARLSSPWLYNQASRLLLLSFFDPLKKGIWAAGKIADVTCDFFTSSVHQNQGREAFDAKFGRERTVLRFHFIGQRFARRKIQFDKYEVLGREFAKLRLRKDGFGELHTPDTPIRAGKVEQHQLVLLPGLGKRCTVVSLPTFRPRRTKKQDRVKKQYHREQRKRLHGVVNVPQSRKNSTLGRNRGCRDFSNRLFERCKSRPGQHGCRIEIRKDVRVNGRRSFGAVGGCVSDHQGIVGAQLLWRRSPAEP